MITEFIPAKPIKTLDMTAAKIAPLTGVSDKQIAYGERQRAIQIRDAVDHLNRKIGEINMRIGPNTPADSRIRKIGIAYKEAFISVLNDMLKNHDASYWCELAGSMKLTVEAHSAAYEAETAFRNANPPQQF